MVAIWNVMTHVLYSDRCTMTVFLSLIGVIHCYRDFNCRAYEMTSIGLFDNVVHREESEFHQGVGCQPGRPGRHKTKRSTG